MKAYEMCRRIAGLTALGALVLALASHAAGGATGAQVVQTNLVDVHANAGKLSNRECLACHARIATDVSVSKKVKTYHRLHLESKLTTPKDCADCHQAIDLRNGSAATLRKQVDPEICAGCHGGGMEGAKVLYAR
jgi:hypothetical protein